MVPSEPTLQSAGQAVLQPSLVPRSARTTRPAALAAIVAVSAGISFSLLANLPHAADEDGYLPIARAIAAGHGWVGADGLPQVFRPPLFSLLLGGWFATVGEHPLSVPIFQSIMLGLGAALVPLLARACGAKGAWPLVAGLFYALHPFVFTNVGFVHQEPALAFLTAAGCVGSIALLHSPSRARALSCGLLWGIAILGKVVFLFSPFLTALFAVRANLFRGGAASLDMSQTTPIHAASAARSNRMNSRAGWARIELLTIVIISSLGVVSLWTVRNAFVFHRFILVNDQVLNQLQWIVAGGSPDASAGTEGDAEGLRFIQRARAELASRADLDADGRRRALSQLLLNYVASHPAQFVKHVLRGMIRFTGLERAWFRDNGSWPGGTYGPLYVVLYLLLQIPLFGGALLRIAIGWRRDSRSVHFLSAFLLVYWAGHLFFFGLARYALPIYPILAALAASLPCLKGTIITRSAVPSGSLALNGASS